MVFKNACFIKPDVLFETGFKKENYAPMFRKKFQINKLNNAKLYVCGLGYGYYYINGQSVSKDLFTAPVSDYTKTLWYNAYDVSGLLRLGENTVAVMCGNGWYNESQPSSWNFDQAKWRDVPKFIMALWIDGVQSVVSDGNWKCMPKSAIWFNALRSGEYFDANLYDPRWKDHDFNDDCWLDAVVDEKPPNGEFRQCLCEPIREHEVYAPQHIYRKAADSYIYDIGQNISGYVRLTVSGEKGDRLVIRYAEQINDDFSLQLNDMPRHYPESEFQTDQFICSGKKTTWSPKFTYHGFRYILIEGLRSPDEAEVAGVFVHQAVESRTEFQCSDEFLNKLFHMGRISSLSNMFYMLTDCPTREKLGWTNDAQASAEQMLTNFCVEKLFGKWLIDIWDAMREDGALPGIVPTAGWGFEWGNGPVSDGVLFELPYKIYTHTGDDFLLKNSLAKFEKYFSFIRTKTCEDGLVHFGLADWANPNANEAVPAAFVNAVLLHYFYSIAALSSTLNNLDAETFLQEAQRQKLIIFSRYLNPDGTCNIDEQSAVALLIYFDLYVELEPLKEQLKHLVESRCFTHNCGMVGLRRLYISLNKCGLWEYAYKIITSQNSPGYFEWFDSNATTLWEMWGKDKHTDSKNHHMYSDVMSWMIKTILGINAVEGIVKFSEVEIKPYFLKQLRFAHGVCRTVSGDISVDWSRGHEGINIHIKIPGGIKAMFYGKVLTHGDNEFFIGNVDVSNLYKQEGSLA